ncbi:hypothetical protein JR316_0004518 [Psilocybe cubensis]|nr:hypothetical protein JR316_0004518 [Psilocybe cubensis]KAH9482418.1 hypothetical protein JR316_0004518 [Psilocybe cubensis]
MNEYTWGKMMDDYVYLEEMSRRVGNWGKEIVRGGYMAAGAGRGEARGRGRGGARGRGRGGAGCGGHGHGRTKRDILKMQLDQRDIDMELLSQGMEKRKANQSTWDTKNQTALLTIEFKFHKPMDPFSPSPQEPLPPFTILTHRNNISSPLLTLLRSHLPERGTTKKETATPIWARRLIFPDPDDPEAFTNPQCVMVAQVDPLTLRRANLDSKSKKVFHSLDPTKPLLESLKNTQFVEYPTIEIWEEFSGTIIDTQGILKQDEEERPVKRRKMSRKAGKMAIAGLLGEYGSEDEDELAKEEPKSVLAALGDYVDSEEGEEDNMDEAKLVEGDALEDVDLDELSDDLEGEVQVDPAVLLELMRAARGGEWVPEGDDAVDWGDIVDES